MLLCTPFQISLSYTVVYSKRLWNKDYGQYPSLGIDEWANRPFSREISYATSMWVILKQSNQIDNTVSTFSFFKKTKQKPSRPSYLYNSSSKPFWAQTILVRQKYQQASYLYSPSEFLKWTGGIRFWWNSSEVFNSLLTHARNKNKAIFML